MRIISWVRVEERPTEQPHVREQRKSDVEVIETGVETLCERKSYIELVKISMVFQV